MDLYYDFGSQLSHILLIDPLNALDKWSILGNFGGFYFVLPVFEQQISSGDGRDADCEVTFVLLDEFLHNLYQI